VSDAYVRNLRSPLFFSSPPRPLIVYPRVLYLPASRAIAIAGNTVTHHSSERHQRAPLPHSGSSDLGRSEMHEKRQRNAGKESAERADDGLATLRNQSRSVKRRDFISPLFRRDPASLVAGCLTISWGNVRSIKRNDSTGDTSLQRVVESQVPRLEGGGTFREMS